jgi:hypothetical protein
MKATLTQRGGDGIKRKQMANLIRSGKITNKKALTDSVRYELTEGSL